jgi:hypothetical protein
MPGTTQPSNLSRNSHPNLQPDADLVRISAAAKYLDISPGTLTNWITYKKFTKADGLRKMGGVTRIHMPTLKARSADGTLTAMAGR